MNYAIYLFDSPESHENLLPLSFTRPVADFRIGITTIREKWQHFLPGDYRYFPVEYLREKFCPVLPGSDVHLFIAGALLPDSHIADAIARLLPGQAICHNGQPLAFVGTLEDLEGKKWSPVDFEGEVRIAEHTFDVFRLNSRQITDDFFAITAGRVSAEPDESTRIIGPFTDTEGRRMLFIEEGANVTGATINLRKGPVYVGKDAEIMEGACVRGPLALCHDAKIKMGAQIYEACTFGPFCKVGGEIDNSVIFGFSNKAHGGYLGNAVIGEWCNIGAGVNASNLKNDYSKIRVWNYHTHTFMRTTLQFCGLIMGDHSKIGVNCMLNTATVIGVGVNIHGAGFPRVFVPSFSEGTPGIGFTSVPIKKFHEIAERVMARRGLPFTDDDRRIYDKVYEVAAEFKK